MSVFCLGKPSRDFDIFGSINISVVGFFGVSGVSSVKIHQETWWSPSYFASIVDGVPIEVLR